MASFLACTRKRYPEKCPVLLGAPDAIGAMSRFATLGSLGEWEKLSLLHSNEKGEINGECAVLETTAALFDRLCGIEWV